MGLSYNNFRYCCSKYVSNNAQKLVQENKVRIRHSKSDNLGLSPLKSNMPDTHNLWHFKTLIEIQVKIVNSTE